MALSLGLENIQVKEEVYTSTEELLQAELEFQDAYQVFTDYKNVCEIVVKSKVSEESMAFASNLLNASVENIEVSAEALADKLKAAWDKFVAMWDKFFSWFKGVITKIKPVKFPVTVIPDTNILTKLSVVVDSFSSIGDVRDRVEKLRRIGKLFDTSEITIKNKEEAQAWIKAAKYAIHQMNIAIKDEKRNYIRNRLDNGDADNAELIRGQIGQRRKFAESRNKDPHDPSIKSNYLASERFIMMFVPKFISKIQASISKLK